MTVAFVVTILTYTKVWDPRPVMDAWLAKLVVLSSPAPTWTGRAAGEPDSAAVMQDGTTCGRQPGLRQRVRRRYDGTAVWQFQVNWVLTAGDVVVAQQRPANPDAHPSPQAGYSVIDPASGAVLWGDPEAIAAWAYSTTIIDLTCPAAGNCQLRSRAHRGNGVVSWTVDVPDGARLIRGGNPALAGTRDPAEWFAKAALGTPGVVPRGLRAPGRRAGSNWSTPSGTRWRGRSLRPTG